MEKTAVLNKNLIADPDRVLNFSCNLGIRLIRNGAEIYRVEDSIERVIRAYGYENVEVFAIPSFIIINIQVGVKNHTKSIRVRTSANNLDRLDKLNALSRKICSDHIDINTAEAMLQEIVSAPGYPVWLSYLGYGAAALFFTLFWGGNVFDSLVAFFCGITVRFTVTYFKNLKANFFFTNLIASALLAIFPAILSYIFTGLHLDKIIIGAIMLLVPGVAIINVMRDILAGDMLTAVAKITEVLIVAVAIAIGISIPIAGVRMAATALFGIV